MTIRTLLHLRLKRANAVALFDTVVYPRSHVVSISYAKWA
jgi:hypothetical protein